MYDEDETSKYELEDFLMAELKIKLLAKRKKNSKRQHNPHDELKLALMPIPRNKITKSTIDFTEIQAWRLKVTSRSCRGVPGMACNYRVKVPKVPSKGVRREVESEGSLGDKTLA